jgi:hypothetical protein
MQQSRLGSVGHQALVTLVEQILDGQLLQILQLLNDVGLDSLSHEIDIAMGASERLRNGRIDYAQLL